jgi:hypothetical protein
VTIDGDAPRSIRHSFSTWCTRCSSPCLLSKCGTQQMCWNATRLNSIDSSVPIRDGCQYMMPLAQREVRACGSYPRHVVASAAVRSSTKQWSITPLAAAVAFCRVAMSTAASRHRIARGFADRRTKTLRSTCGFAACRRPARCSRPTPACADQDIVGSQAVVLPVAKSTFPTAAIR